MDTNVINIFHVCLKKAPVDTRPSATRAESPRESTESTGVARLQPGLFLNKMFVFHKDPCRRPLPLARDHLLQSTAL